MQPRRARPSARPARRASYCQRPCLGASLACSGLGESGRRRGGRWGGMRGFGGRRSTSGWTLPRRHRRRGCDACGDLGSPIEPCRQAGSIEAQRGAYLRACRTPRSATRVVAGGPAPQTPPFPCEADAVGGEFAGTTMSRKMYASIAGG